MFEGLSRLETGEEKKDSFLRLRPLVNKSIDSCLQLPAQLLGPYPSITQSEDEDEDSNHR